MKTAPAKVIRIDNRNDLALLKFDGAPPLPAVRLGIGVKVESGERVTVIGNPGVGRMILDYAMTEGIVSNPRRSLRDQSLIHTSAAVNPGCSGAPMFNSNALVIGLVDLKANIENAGFAVPADDLGAFLAVAVSTSGPGVAIERQWFDASGEHATSAQYLDFRQGAVRMRRTDGKEISVPLGKLSQQDQAFIRLLHPGAANASPQ